MKKINLSAALRSVAVVALAVFAVSCDEPKPTDDNGGDPEKIEIADIKEAKPGEPQSVTFKAAAVWTISSDKQWCTPDKSTGQAGDNTVSFTITDAEQVFDVNDVATISIFYGKEIEASFTIERAAKERVMEFFAEKTDGEETVWEKTAAMVFASTGGSSFRAKIRITANFNWELSTVPSWIDITSAMPNNSGSDDGKPVVMWLTCITSNLETGAMTGEIGFKDTDAKKDVYTLKAEFAGTGDDFLYFEVEDFEVAFTAEGKVAKDEADFYPATLYGSEYGFIPLIFNGEHFGSGEFDENDVEIVVADWVHITPAPAKSALTTTEMSITVDEGTKAREAWIMLLPKAKYDEVKADPWKLITDDGKELLPEYDDYYVCKVTQKGPDPVKLLEGGFPAGVELVKTSDGGGVMGGGPEFELRIPAFSTENIKVSLMLPYSQDIYYGNVFGELYFEEEPKGWVTFNPETDATVSEDGKSDIYTVTILKNGSEEVRKNASFSLISDMMFANITIIQQPAE